MPRRYDAGKLAVNDSFAQTAAGWIGSIQHDLHFSIVGLIRARRGWSTGDLPKPESL